MAGNNTENTMNKKHGLLFRFAVIAIAAMFTVTGCSKGDDDSGGGGVPTGTIKLTQSAEQKTANKFTLTLTGLTWVKEESFDIYSFLDIDGDVTAGNVDTHNKKIGRTLDIRMTQERITDTVITVTMSQYNFVNDYYYGSGKLKLRNLAEKDGYFTVGADIIKTCTQEGLAYASDPYNDHDNLNGKLTEASGSASVSFNIARHE
jgi:hypothetical protein